MTINEQLGMMNFSSVREAYKLLLKKKAKVSNDEEDENTHWESREFWIRGSRRSLKFYWCKYDY